MSSGDQLLDERIRQALRPPPAGPTDLAGAEALVRSRGSARLRRRRAAVGAVVVLAGLAGAMAVASGRGDDQVITTPSAPTTTSTTIDYGFAPLTPLLDAPLPVTGPLVVTRLGGQRLEVDSEPTTLGVTIRNEQSGGSMSGDPMRMGALEITASSGGSGMPSDVGYVYGMTRPEAAFAELTVGSREPVRMATLAIDALRQLRFFVFEVPAALLDPEAQERYTVTVLDSSGGVLTDSDRTLTEQGASGDAMQQRG